MVYIIGGLPGAGKSTYSQKLSVLKNSVVFSTDVWMSDLYWMDKSPGADVKWALERVERCEVRMIKTCSQLARVNVSSILDIGFVNKKYRQKTYDKLDSLDLDYEIHFLNVDEGTRWERVKQRNIEKPETFSFEVTRDMFDFMGNHFDELLVSETDKKVIHIEN